MPDTLFYAARAAMARAYAPYSNFPVGAAILANNGQIYVGANIENLSFPEGWCAETTAIGHMIMDGASKIVEIAVCAEKLAQCPPCGGCRQRIREFSDPQTKIHLCDENGVAKSLSMDALLPHAFDTDVIIPTQ